MGNLSALFTAVFPVNSAWPGTGLRTHLQEEAVWEDRVGIGQGEEKQGETLTVPLSSRAGTHKWSFAHPHPSPGSFPSLRTLGATLGQCPGTEVDRLAFFAWAQRQTSPGLSDLSAEQLINPESEISQREQQGYRVFTWHHPSLLERRPSTLSVFRLLSLKKTSIKDQTSQERFNLLSFERQKYKMFSTIF